MRITTVALLGVLAGIIVTVLSVYVVIRLVRQKSVVDGGLQPCVWRIVVKDDTGRGVPGVELVVMDRQTGKLWNSIGNWNQSDPLITDDDGRVAFFLRQEYGFGGESLAICSYGTSDVPDLSLCVRYRGDTLFTLPLEQAVSDGEIVLVIAPFTPGASPPPHAVGQAESNFLSLPGREDMFAAPSGGNANDSSQPYAKDQSHRGMGAPCGDGLGPDGVHAFVQ